MNWRIWWRMNVRVAGGSRLTERSGGRPVPTWVFPERRHRTNYPSKVERNNASLPTHVTNVAKRSSGCAECAGRRRATAVAESTLVAATTNAFCSSSVSSDFSVVRFDADEESSGCQACPIARCSVLARFQRRLNQSQRVSPGNCRTNDPATCRTLSGTHPIRGLPDPLTGRAATSRQLPARSATPWQMRSPCLLERRRPRGFLCPSSCSRAHSYAPRRGSAVCPWGRLRGRS